MMAEMAMIITVNIILTIEVVNLIVLDSGSRGGNSNDES